MNKYSKSIVNLSLTLEGIQFGLFQIITFLNNFQTTPLNIKRNIYIQGPHGIGKSTFIMKLLHKLQYDKL